ncbi:MAG: tyrosine-type recombinase/integrase [Burkholderiales bacterium]|nr:tyrosine-type recombinase/integrase [Burkholderiales bacterium]MBP9768785.1 tyrosine-type recombinase/integrase [Burkholderiales bacterium]
MWLKYQKLTLKSVNRKHLQAYIDFIQNPDKTWVGKRRRFCHPDWRPFRKPLTNNAIEHNVQIVRQLFAYLQNTGYLGCNCSKHNFDIPYSPYNSLASDHYLTRKELNLIGNFIGNLPGNTYSRYIFKIRSRWIFQVMLFTGCRKSEISDATMDDFIIIKNKLWLQVNGKGSKYGIVPIPTHLELRLNIYRAIYKLPRIKERTSPEGHIPLVIKSFSSQRYTSVTHGYIWHVVKLIGNDLADTIHDEVLSARMRRISPHWLRHTCATLQINSGIDIRAVKANLRHALIQTTMLYLHLDADHQHNETITKFGKNLIN